MDLLRSDATKDWPRTLRVVVTLIAWRLTGVGGLLAAAAVVSR